MLPTHSEMLEEDNAKDELPCFGNKTAGEIKFEDPLEDDHQEIANLLEKISDQKEDMDNQIQPIMMSNDDSFSNIAPAILDDKD